VFPDIIAYSASDADRTDKPRSLCDASEEDIMATSRVIQPVGFFVWLIADFAKKEMKFAAIWVWKILGLGSCFGLEIIPCLFWLS
jgi:hypothetical protein